MSELKDTRRRRPALKRISLAQWLTLTGLVLMVLKAGFELAKAVLNLL